MEVAEWRERLDGISYHKWQKLKRLIDGEFEIKLSKCERDLTLGLPDETTENLLQFG